MRTKSSSDKRERPEDRRSEVRRRIVSLREGGESVTNICDRVGLSRNTVYAFLKRYQTEGESAFRLEAPGRKLGTGRSLTSVQEAVVVHAVRRRPFAYKLKKYLWDRETLKHLIIQKCGMTLSIRALGNYLERWGLTPKNPNKKAPDRCSREVKAWLNANYSELKLRAKKEGAEIYWANVPVVFKKAEPIPHPQDTVIHAATAQRITPPESEIFASVESSKGKVLWAIFDGAFNAAAQIKLCKALLADTRTKVFLIRNAETHYRSGAFMHWLSHHKDASRIDLFPP